MAKKCAQRVATAMNHPYVQHTTENPRRAHSIVTRIFNRLKQFGAHLADTAEKMARYMEQMRLPRHDVRMQAPFIPSGLDAAFGRP